MKLKRFYPLAIFIGVAAIATADILSDNGKAGKTGSPGETSCTNCHNSYAVNSGGGSITISSSNMTNWQYIPGQVYHINVTVARAANSLFGVGFEALKASGNTPAGTFTITTSGSTGIKSATIGGVVRPNIVHKLNGGIGNGSKVFSFDWVAPSTNVGNIIFYAAGDACNNDGNESGDYVYTTTQTITPASTTGITNVMSENGLLKVYPNPAHSEITVDYTLNSPSQVQISILNLGGQRILSLLNETQFGGFYTEQFNLGNQLPKGVYLVSLESSGERKLKKLIIQ
ncbi:MAG: T9SS type A sorting domain-containing protein [Bacteroidetes bacterium]|nr:T9SS type A sorting domain-containing protein [Bacteroidota bacterium]